MQIATPCEGYDVCIVGSGAGGGMAAKVLAEGGRRRRAARGRPQWDANKDGAMFTVDLRLAAARRRVRAQALRRVRRLHRRLGHRGRALHGRRRRALPLVPRPHARRPHQPLGTHLAALRPLGLQGAQPRRPRRRLADRLRRHQALLRQARPAGRPLRHQRGPAQRARRHLPAAAHAARLRAAGQEGLRPAPHHLHPVAPLDPDQAPQRPPGLPLLRPVRPRLCDALELLDALRAAAPRPRDRPPQDRDRRHGPRGFTNNEGLATGVSYVDTATGREERCGRRSSSSPPAPASRRGCC